ncbi:MAG: hypothetical protein KI790_08870 [Cyclobacteriaceae bacterium]|nr:hypothetical protein [Cyclobacteriaceae bacterium HetDA_MAG_MS6]
MEALGDSRAGDRLRSFSFRFGSGRISTVASGEGVRSTRFLDTIELPDATFF